MKLRKRLRNWIGRWVFDLSASRHATEEVLSDYPYLESEDARQTIQVAKLCNSPVSIEDQRAFKYAGR